jgi:hypothetical protein
VFEEVSEGRVPDSAGLAQSIQGFVQSADTLGMSGVFKPYGLLHEDFFLQCSIQKSCRYVELTHLQVVGSNDGEDDTDAIHAYHRRVGLEEANTRPLRVALYYKASLVSSNRSISAKLEFICPLTCNCNAVLRQGSERPGVIRK